MLYGEKENASRRRWKRFFIFSALSAFIVVSVNATVPDKRVSTRVPRQELSLEDRLAAEQLLSTLGYWTGPIDGDFDAGSRHALIAFQKVEGRRRTGRLTTEELQALRSANRPVPRRTGYAHIEIDLARQVLFIVDASGSITHILPVCTGNGKAYVDHGQLHQAHTPRGTFKVLRKVYEGKDLG